MKRILFLALLFLTLTACKHAVAPKYVAVAEGTVVQVPALASGKLIAMNVKEGQEVQSGDIIAVVDTLALHYQLQELDGSLREIAAQRALQQTQIAQAQTDVTYLDTKYGRNQTLVQENSLPPQSLDDLGNQRDKANTTLRLATEQDRVLTAKEAQLQARRAQLRKAIADAVVRAPAHGIVSTLYNRAGEAAVAMKPVIELTELDEIEATIYLAETELSQVKQGQAVKVKLDGRNETLPGAVEWISPKSEFTPKQVLTPDNRTSLVYAVRIRIPNPDGLIKHGMPLEVVR